MNLTNKARTLQSLSNKLTTAKILPLLIVEHTKWLENESFYVKEAMQRFLPLKLIVRSSSFSEDTLKAAIDALFDSYEEKGQRSGYDVIYAKKGVDKQSEEAFIRSMLQDIKLSGVAFTCGLVNSATPYCIANYSETGLIKT